MGRWITFSKAYIIYEKSSVGGLLMTVSFAVQTYVI